MKIAVIFVVLPICTLAALTEVRKCFMTTKNGTKVADGRCENALEDATCEQRFEAPTNNGWSSAQVDPRCYDPTSHSNDCAKRCFLCCEDTNYNWANDCPGDNPDCSQLNTFVSCTTDYMFKNCKGVCRLPCLTTTTTPPTRLVVDWSNNLMAVTYPTAGLKPPTQERVCAGRPNTREFKYTGGGAVITTVYLSGGLPMRNVICAGSDGLPQATRMCICTPTGICYTGSTDNIQFHIASYCQGNSCAGYGLLVSTAAGLYSLNPVYGQGPVVTYAEEILPNGLMADLPGRYIKIESVRCLTTTANSQNCMPITCY